jgi:hypothetical protein
MLCILTLLAAVSFPGIASAAPPLQLSQRWALLVGVDDYVYAENP